MAWLDEGWNLYSRQFRKRQDMTHGRSAKASVNPRTKKRVPLLTGLAEEHEKSLESRVARLEARVEQMQEEIDRLSGGVPAHIQEAIDSIGRSHRGPLKKMDDTELVLNRDNLVQWLEEHWPTIVKRLLAARTPRDVAAVLRPIATAREIRAQWQKTIVEHPAKLLEFLRSDKFRRKPPKKTVVDALKPYRSEPRQRSANRLPTRQIANAMAGVPKLKWRTSLDKCSKTPSTYPVGHNTASYYRTVLGIHQ
jgi:hypothetical protein